MAVARTGAVAPHTTTTRRLAHAGGNSRVSLVEQAYTEIRRRILDNEYPPSSQVLEQQLAVDLCMSRTPVREALVRLQNEQFVEVIPRHGMRVVPLSHEDLRDMYEVLTALELAAIERLARSEPPAAMLRPLEKALDQMDDALRGRNLEAWVHADERFHRILIDLCGNRRLAAMAATVWEQGHRARMTTVRLRKSLVKSNREHREVVTAIQHGNWREAKTKHLRHRERTRKEILALIEQARFGRV